MMAPTHVVVGPVLALPLLVLAPELAVIGAIAAVIGGIVPDLDVLIGTHRRTFHYPVASWFLAIPALVVAVVVANAQLVAVAMFCLAVAVHAGLDAFGGGPELAPWEGNSDRGVYSHVGNRWLPPRRLIRYDGSPEDVGVVIVCAVPGLLWFDTTVTAITATAVFVAVVYGLLRRRIPRYLEPIVG